MIGSPVRNALVRGVLVLTLGLSAAMPAGAVAVEPDDTFAGAVPLISPHAGDLSATDTKDIFKIEAAGDSVITIVLNGPIGQDFDLKLYGNEVLDSPAPPPTYVVALSQAADSSAESITYLVPPGPTRTYFLEVVAFAGASGGYTLTGSVAAEGAPRLAGSDRYRTSYAVSASTFATASAVVVASGAKFPDALSAAGLAGAVNGPVLLAPYTTDANDPRVIDLCREVVRLGATQVYVVGGRSAVTTQVVDALTDIGKVAEPPIPVAGGTRAQTALAVAAKIDELTDGPIPAIFVVREDSYPDALAVSPFAYARQLPILLTSRSVLNPDVSAFIESHDTTDIIVAGGTGAIYPGVESALDALNEGETNVVRMSGDSRIETAVDVAEKCVSRGWGTWDRIGIATSANFPDALSGGFACGERSGVLLLTTSAELSPAAGTAIGNHAVAGSMAIVLGGQKAVIDTVRWQITNLLP